MWSLHTRFSSFSRQYLIDAETEQDIFEEVVNGELDFKAEAWTKISDSAKDLVTKMLDRDTKKRLTAHDVLCKSLWFVLAI